MQNEENELITTVTLHLTDASGRMVMATWKDLTPNDPTGQSVDTLFLKDTTLYTGTLELLDETKSPAVNISEEVRQEGVDHLVVYKSASALATPFLEIVRTDKDANQRELGLSFNIKPLQKATGTLRVLLRHQPGEKDGSETPGDSDVDITVPVVVR